MRNVCDKNKRSPQTAERNDVVWFGSKPAWVSRFDSKKPCSSRDLRWAVGAQRMIENGCWGGLCISKKFEDSHQTPNFPTCDQTFKTDGHNREKSPLFSSRDRRCPAAALLCVSLSSPMLAGGGCLEAREALSR